MMVGDGRFPARHAERAKAVVSINRTVGFLVLALVVFFIITQPTSAARTVRSLGHTLRDAAEQSAVFLREVSDN